MASHVVIYVLTYVLIYVIILRTDTTFQGCSVANTSHYIGWHVCTTSMLVESVRCEFRETSTRYAFVFLPWEKHLRKDASSQALESHTLAVVLMLVCMPANTVLPIY